MTNWNQYGSPLEINQQSTRNSFEEFLGTLPGNEDGDPFWELNEDDEVTPISYKTERPENYVKGYLDIVKWLKKRNRNYESGYAFTYQDDENPDDRSVGAMNSNNEGVKFVQINGDGTIIQESFKI